MNRLRRRSRIAAWFALISLLFMHAALADYQCPGEAFAMAAGQSEAAQDGASRSPPGCDGMDMDQPALCQAHAQAGNQSVDKPSLLVPSFTEARHHFVQVDTDPTPTAHASHALPGYLLRTVAPPIAVRNCCFRI